MRRIYLAFLCFFRVLFGKPLPAELAPAPAAPQLPAPAPAPASAPALPAARLASRTAPEPGALQLLGMFQREGRLIDFLCEPIDGYDDAAVGVAVRDIHRGLKKVLDDHFTVEPVVMGEENGPITVDPDFDPARIRLVGHSGRAGGGRGPVTAAPARHVVGIDLGTTASAVAVVDTAEAPIVMMPVAQVVAPGQVEARPTLPSYLYLPGAHDLPAGALALPWDPARTWVVGELARARGAEVPARLVASAKSWLCHPAVDLTGPILPWGAPEEVEKLSPVDASARYLEHLAQAFAHAHGGAPLAEQEIYVTVPASFDAVARELTVAAARKAGLPHVTLLEEPQAAFYSWLARAGGQRSPASGRTRQPAANG